MTLVMPAPRRISARSLAAALAFCMAFETASAQAAPSPRDLAYEQGVQAEEARDFEAAAVRFTEAYRLTPAGETGPRLLFLRSAVAARIRAHERAPDTARHLCEAQALLRDYLGDAPPAAGQDPLAPERESLARVDAQLAGADCASLKPVSSGTSAPGAPVPEGTSGPDAVQPVPGDSSGTRPIPGDTSNPGTTPAPGADPSPGNTPGTTPVSPDISQPDPRPRRALLAAGATGLALGAAAFVVMGVGVGIARDATRDGRAQCWSMGDGCTSNADGVPEILGRGQLGDQLVKAGATIGGLTSLAGVVLLALSARARPSARVAVTPRLVLGAGAGGQPRASLGIGLSGRF